MLQNGKDKGKAIKVLAWGQDVRKNERKAKKQDIEFFLNEKGPTTFVVGSLVFNS